MEPIPVKLINIDYYINPQAIEDALKKLQRNRSPGLDVFTAEYVSSLNTGGAVVVYVVQQL